MPAGEKYSLWFMPTGDVFARLSEILQRLSARYGAPKFPPHVTLLGGCVGPRCELIRKSAQVAAGIRPFTIRLGEIHCLDEYFRCLFVRAALTRPLQNANLAARQAFDSRREPEFMPHLSLLYGNFPQCLKESAIAEIGPRLDVQFKVRTLHLYRTHGAPGQWLRVASFGLTI
jgi:2'-5' RNA ligase